MNIREMSDALMKLAFEMTASMETANMCIADMCIADMDLDDHEELFDIAQYLKFLVQKALQEATL